MDIHERRAWNAAQKIQHDEYDRPVFCGGRKYESAEALLAACETAPRSGVFGSEDVVIGLEASNVVDELMMNEAAPADYEVSKDAQKFIADFCDMFNELFGTKVTVPDYTVGILFEGAAA